jgi:hypothetical protein
VFPVFGQGRVLYALVGAGINEMTIAETCGFLVGACSCQVKALNPGTDLLIWADWWAGLEGLGGPQPLAGVMGHASPEQPTGPMSRRAARRATWVTRSTASSAWRRIGGCRTAAWRLGALALNQH